MDKLVNRFDKAIQKMENESISLVKDALQQSFDRLELEIRRRYPKVEQEGGLLAAQRNAAILLQQIKAFMQLIDASQAAKLDASFQALLTEAGLQGQTFAMNAIHAIAPGNPVFKPQIPIEAVRYAAEDSVERLKSHGDAFAKRTSTIIAQGLIQGWGMDRTVKLMADQLDVARTNAVTIVRTETMQATTKAAMATYQENGIQYVMRHSAVGERVCVVCSARTGEITRLDQTIVVLHPRCRDYVTPVSPQWLRLGLIDLKWAENFHRDVVKALPEGVKPKYDALAPFEKSAGMEKRPKPVWSPKGGFLDAAFKKEAGV